MLGVQFAVSAFLPAAIGAVVGAIGSLWFILRSDAFSDRGKADNDPPDDRRKLAVRIVLAGYAVIAWICFVVAVAIGDMSFILPAGITALLATVGLVGLWSPRPRGNHPTSDS